MRLQDKPILLFAIKIALFIIAILGFAFILYPRISLSFSINMAGFLLIFIFANWRSLKEEKTNKSTEPQSFQAYTKYIFLIMSVITFMVIALKYQHNFMAGLPYLLASLISEGAIYLSLIIGSPRSELITTRADRKLAARTLIQGLMYLFIGIVIMTLCILYLSRNWALAILLPLYLSLIFLPWALHAGYDQLRKTNSTR